MYLSFLNQNSGTLTSANMYVCRLMYIVLLLRFLAYYILPQQVMADIRATAPDACFARDENTYVCMYVHIRILIITPPKPKPIKRKETRPQKPHLPIPLELALKCLL